MIKRLVFAAAIFCAGCGEPRLGGTEKINNREGGSIETADAPKSFALNSAAQSAACYTLTRDSRFIHGATTEKLALNANSNDMGACGQQTPVKTCGDAAKVHCDNWDSPRARACGRVMLQSGCFSPKGISDFAAVGIQPPPPMNVACYNQYRSNFFPSWVKDSPLEASVAD